MVAIHQLHGYLMRGYKFTGIEREIKKLKKARRLHQLTDPAGHFYLGRVYEDISTQRFTVSLVKGQR